MVRPAGVVRPGELGLEGEAHGGQRALSAGGSRTARRRFIGTFFGIFEASRNLPVHAPFQILEHPADIGFRAFGDTLAELFENAAVALVSIASEIEDVAPREAYPFEAVAPDVESLLVAWLSEVLYWFDGKRIAFRSFRVLEIASERMIGRGMGEPRDPNHHRQKLIVKAVTWHQLRIREDQGQWTAEVYLDV